MSLGMRLRKNGGENETA